MDSNLFLGKLAGLILGDIDKSDDDYREIGDEVLSRMKEHPDLEEALDNTIKNMQLEKYNMVKS